MALKNGLTRSAIKNGIEQNRRYDGDLLKHQQNALRATKVMEQIEKIKKINFIVQN